MAPRCSMGAPLPHRRTEEVVGLTRRPRQAQRRACVVISGRGHHRRRTARQSTQGGDGVKDFIKGRAGHDTRRLGRLNTGREVPSRNLRVRRYSPACLLVRHWSEGAATVRVRAQQRNGVAVLEHLPVPRNGQPTRRQLYQTVLCLRNTLRHRGGVHSIRSRRIRRRRRRRSRRSDGSR